MPFKKKTEAEHTAELARYGRVELVGSYTDRKTITTYRCLVHSEIHAASPTSLRNGGGLACCRDEALRLNAIQAKQKASDSYDALLRTFGKVRRLGSYEGAHRKIAHRCLQHGEIHLCSPTHAKKGQGLKCCQIQNGITDSVEKALAGTHRFAEAEATSLYVYELANHPGYLKPGIAKDCRQRAWMSLDQYGEQVCSWERDHRALVFLPEQALLKATRLMAHRPSALAGWAGATEVRRMDADALVDMAQELMDELDSCANPWEFALDHGLLTPAQEKRARVLIRAGVISEAELASVEVAA